MDAHKDGSRSELVTFLPHRLNRQPVVVRGLTADEMWICAGLAAAAGFVVGLLLAWITGSLPMLPTAIVASIALGIFLGGGILRRRKRGRPDTWLYRHLQWRIALRHPSVARYVGGHRLITRSGWWTTRRSALPLPSPKRWIQLRRPRRGPSP